MLFKTGAWFHFVHRTMVKVLSLSATHGHARKGCFQEERRSTSPCPDTRLTSILIFVLTAFFKSNALLYVIDLHSFVIQKAKLIGVLLVKKIFFLFLFPIWPDARNYFHADWWVLRRRSSATGSDVFETERQRHETVHRTALREVRQNGARQGLLPSQNQQTHGPCQGTLWQATTPYAAWSNECWLSVLLVDSIRFRFWCFVLIWPISMVTCNIDIWYPPVLLVLRRRGTTCGLQWIFMRPCTYNSKCKLCALIQTKRIQTVLIKTGCAWIKNIFCCMKVLYRNTAKQTCGSGLGSVCWSSRTEEMQKIPWTDWRP